MGIRDLLFVGLVLGGAAGLGASLYPPRLDAGKAERPTRPDARRRSRRDRVAGSTRRFADAGTTRDSRPRPGAPVTAVVRRLSLALTGTIPSLEEIRRFEAVPDGPDGSTRWLDDLLRDRRYGDYLAERFARAFVGTEDGPFLVFRRRRFVAWLSDAAPGEPALRRDRPRPDRRRRPLDRPPGDQLRHRDLRPRQEGRPTPSGWPAGSPGPSSASGSTAPSATTTRSSPGSRPTSAASPPSSARPSRGLTGIHDDRGRVSAAPTARPASRSIVEPRVPFLPELLPGRHGRPPRDGSPAG